MKKILCLFILLLAFTKFLFAAQMKHFNFYVDSASIQSEQVSEYFSTWFDLPNSTSFVQSKMLSDDEGYVHYCYNQYVNGYMVNGCQILVHTKNDIVQYINGVVLEAEETGSPVTNKIARKSTSVNEGKEIIILPTKNDSDFRYAYKYISDELGAYVYIDAENGDTLRISPFIYNAQTEITTNTIYSGRQKMTVEKVELQCKYSVASPRIETVNSTNVDFSANTKSLYNTQIKNAIAYSEAEADSLNSYLTSVTFSSTNKEWWSDLEDGTSDYPDLYMKIYNSSNELVYQSHVCDDWRYVDITFNPLLVLDGTKYTIAIYDEDVINDDYGGGFTISSQTKGIGTLSLDNFDVTVNVTGNPIRDAHWGMEKTLAFYKNILNRDSYDGNGATIYQFVNPFLPSKLPNQAFACSEAPFCMVYGLGDGINDGPLVSLDIMAHEFTHMVTAHNIAGGLEYNGESGALNEGFSDIFAVLTEGYTYGQYDWTIGEKCDLKNPFSRSLKNPKAGHPSQPDTYGKDPWKDTNSSQDNGGVHYNSGVLNYWFYLLCNGGSGTNDNQQSYSLQGVGESNAAKIAYNTLMYELTNYSATFADARVGSINAVIKLYGKDSQEHKSVVNAWYAVGVGEPYPEKFIIKPGNYVIVAKRDKDTDKNWYYMTSDLGTASTKRLQAVSTGTESMDVIVTSNLDNKYVWTLEADGDNWKLKNGSKYVTWTSGNSATLGSTAKSLTFDIAENKVQAHFNDGTNERYLSLNAAVNNNYFAFYANTLQITDLYFLPYDEGTTPPPTPECKKVPYVETFSSSQGDFTVENPLLPDGFASIWNWDSQYGMVAKATKNQTKYESESWLLSPCIELPEDEKCVLTFSHAAKFFSDTKQMSLWFTTNYITDDPGASDWKQLTIPTYPTGNNWDWFESGEIDLSAYAGEHVVFGFQYTSTTSSAPQWEIKNFTVSPKTTTSVDNAHDNKPSASKILRDGQILILRGDKTYTLTGQQIR